MTTQETLLTQDQNPILLHARAHTASLLLNSPLYAHLLSSIQIISATSTCILAYLPLYPLHLNSKNSLHGSVTCTLIDFIGGVAIACSDLRDNTGVSVDIHVNFIGGAKAGDTLEIEGKVDKVGGSLAFTEANIRKVEEGKGRGEGALVARGRHTKFVKLRS